MTDQPIKAPPKPGDIFGTRRWQPSLADLLDELAKLVSDVREIVHTEYSKEQARPITETYTPEPIKPADPTYRG